MVEELETETQDPIPPLPKGFKVVKSDNGGDLPPLPKGYVQKKNPVGTGSGNGGTVGSSNPPSGVSTKKTGSIDFDASSLQAGNAISTGVGGEEKKVDDGITGKNPLELVGKINDLSKDVNVFVSGGTGGAAAGFSQKPEAAATTKKVNDELTAQGVKPKDIAEIKNDISDLSPEVQKLSVVDKDGNVSYPYSLESLGKLRDVDPIAYKTKLNAVKTYDAIRRTVGTEKANEFSRLQNQNQAKLNQYTDIEDFNRKKEKQKEIIRQTLKGDDRDVAMQRVDENSAIILNDAIPDSKSAEDYLNNRLYQSKGTLSKNLTLHDALMDSQDVEFTGNVNDFKLESIQSKLDPNNPADQIAFAKYKRGINLNNALSHSGNLDEAALNFASSEDDHLAATIKTLNAGGQELPNSYKGEIVANFLNDPEIITKAQDNPEFAKEYTKTAQNLYFNYPDYAKKEIGNLISQEREDKGQNNWFANVPTKENTDKLVDEMVANGKMTELQKNIYLKDIAPELGVGKSIKRGFGHVLAPAFTDNSPIATPDLLTHAGEGWDNTMGGVYKSLKTLNATVNPTLPKSNGEIATDLLTALKNEHETVSVQPKGLLHKAAAASGDFIPLVVSMAVGGGMLKGAGKAGEAINMALQFAGNNAEKALVAFPDSPLKQKMYTGAATSIDMFLGRLLPHNKALSQEVSNSIRKDITGVISDFSSEKITADAAKKTILNRIEDLVTKKAPEILKANTETGGIMAAFSAGHNGLDIAFGAKPPQSVEDFAIETAKAFETGFLGNTLVAAAMAGKNTATVKDNLLKASANPEHYIEQIKIAAAKNPEIAKQQDELINNVNVAVEARKVADAKGMNEKQTEDFILLHVAQGIQENTAKNATVDLVKEEATKQAKDLKARKEKVYGGEVDTKLSVPIDNVDEQGIPIGEDVPPPTEQQSGKDVSKLLDEKANEIAMAMFPEVGDKAYNERNRKEVVKNPIEEVEQMINYYETKDIPEKEKNNSSLLENSKASLEKLKKLRDEYKSLQTESEKQQSGKDGVVDNPALTNEQVMADKAKMDFVKNGGNYNVTEGHDGVEVGLMTATVMSSNGKKGYGQQDTFEESKVKLNADELKQWKQNERDLQLEDISGEEYSNNKKEIIKKAFQRSLNEKNKTTEAKDISPNDGKGKETMVAGTQGKVVDEGVVDKGISFDRKQQNDAYSGISDAENNDPKKTIGEYVASLFDSKNKGKGASQYYVTDRTINGKTVTVRVSDHSHLEGNKTDENGYTVSIVVNGEKAEGLTVNKDYAEINIKANKKNVEDKIHDLYDHFDEIEQKAKSLSTKPEIKNEEAKANENTNKETGDSTPKPETGEAASATTEGKEGGKKPPPIEPAEPVGEDKGGNKVGVSHESLTDLAKRLKLKEPETGEWHSPEWYAERGRELLKGGADPKEVDNPKNELHDRISIARANLENLVKEADKIAREKGVDSKEYEAAHKEVNDYANNVVKKLGTKAGQAMTALQGERDIDTDSFTAVRKAAVDAMDGKPLSKEQEAKIKDLVAKNEELKKRAEEAEKLLIEATDNAMNEGKPKSDKNKFENKAKGLAKKIMDSELPAWLKIDDPNVKKSGLGHDELKKMLADATINMGKLLDKGVQFADAVKEAVKDLGDKLGEGKRDDIEKGFEQHYKDLINQTPEAKNIKRLEKELEDLQRGIAKQKNPPRKSTERENELKEKIKDERAMMGLEPSKMDKPTSESDKIEENVKNAEKQEKEDAEELDKLQKMFVDKNDKDNKFSVNEAKAIWEYGKKNYIDKGVPFRDMIAKVADDLGLTWKQTSTALTSKKTERISDEMWKKSSERLKNQHATKNWIEAQNKSIPFKALRKVSAAFRGVSVFGHGGIFIGTHAGMTLFNPSQWKVVIPAFIRGWKFAYGNKAKYERRIEQLRNDPNYVKAQRAGLKNNPDNVNTEEFQKSQKFFEKIGGEAGIKGFNAIKVLRQDLFNMHYEKLSEAEKNDPEAVEQIAKLVNNATGATNLKMPEWVNEVTFAGGMEATRWGKLTRNPARATAVAFKALVQPEKATTAERVFAKVWARRVGEQVGTMAAMLIANAAIQKAINPNNPTNLTDPDKPDFMKFKFGDLTIDPSSGMRGTAMFIYGLGKIPFMSKKERRGDTPVKYAGKAISGYARGKLAPLYGTMADFFDQQDFNRNPMPFSNEKPGAGHHKLTWTEYAWEKAPLPVAHAAGEMYKAALDHNGGSLTTKHIVDGIIAGVLSGGTGFRIGEYNTEEANHSPYTKEDKADPTFKYFLDKGLELPNTSLNSEVITDKKSMTKKKVSEYPKEIQDKYTETHKQFLKKELADVKRKGYVYTMEYLTGDGEKKIEVYTDKKPHSVRKKIDDLGKEELAQILSTAQSQATRLTKKKIFNQK